MRRFALLLLLGTSCGGEGPDPVVIPTPIDSATTGVVSGTVLFSGTPPANPRLPVGGSSECSALHATPPLDEIVLVKDGRLRNVFVHVKQGLEKRVFDWPRTPVVVANERCVYVPRVAGAQVHQPLRFTNEDPADHNIHGFHTGGGDFNFTVRAKGRFEERKMRQAEVMLRLKCDIHPWMVGYVGVVPHPFFQVTGPDGAFELKNLPPGEYDLEAWHEKYGTKTLKVKLEPKGRATADFTFP